MPTKAAYLELEKDPTLEFEFFLAEKLGRTLTELRETVSAQEFLYWNIYYARKAQRAELELAKVGGKSG